MSLLKKMKPHGDLGYYLDYVDKKKKKWNKQFHIKIMKDNRVLLHVIHPKVLTEIDGLEKSDEFGYVINIQLNSNDAEDVKFIHFFEKSSLIKDTKKLIYDSIYTYFIYCNDDKEKTRNLVTNLLKEVYGLDERTRLKMEVY